MEKLLPQNIDAECGVLGSIIIDPQAYDLIAPVLSAKDFYRDAHRVIYESVEALATRHENVDFLTICDELEHRGQLQDIGNASYITSLINHVPTSGNVEYYARLVARKSEYRRLIHAAGQIAALAFEEDKQALSKAESLIYQISQTSHVDNMRHGSEVMAALLEDIEKLHQRRGQIIGVPTGFTDLDRMTGGLQPSDLIILAGRPGMGKTSLAINLATHALEQSLHVAFFSLEMGDKQILQRILSVKADINSQLLRSGWIDDDRWDSLVGAGDKISEYPFWLDDTGGITVTELRSKARRLQAEHGLDLLIIDYLQLMQGSTENGKRNENRVQEVSEISRSLKALAKELNIPILALSQLSRSVESRQIKIPQLSDLRESGSLEQDSDLVLFVYRDDYYAGYDEQGQSKSDRPGTADIIIAKHRNGPVGEISVKFHASRTQFTDHE